ncbi:MAG: RNA polymerase sporulation sigma factor SigH [Ruminococcaceae bacterium]|nr:RNA polymerase sporulation sigma factor SigH [Oscillospiraceae bacterium]
MDKISNENFASFSDEELVVLAQQGNDRALDYLLSKYFAYVRSKSLSYYIVGADRDDIIQEGMIGLFKAVRDFSSERGVTFKTFADVCVTRQIITAVKNASRQKHAPLNFYVSLNKSVSDDESDSTLGELLEHEKVLNPEEILIKKESVDILGSEMQKLLSTFESQVLSLYLQGNSYLAIGKIVGKDPKAVDNALQRIKKKFEKISSD